MALLIWGRRPKTIDIGPAGAEACSTCGLGWPGPSGGGSTTSSMLPRDEAEDVLAASANSIGVFCLQGVVVRADPKEAARY